jgi:hypothetical protein
MEIKSDACSCKNDLSWERSRDDDLHDGWIPNSKIEEMPDDCRHQRGHVWEAAGIEFVGETNCD